MRNKNLSVMLFSIMTFILCSLSPSIAGSVEITLSNYESNLKTILKNNKEYNGHIILIDQITLENTSGIDAFAYYSDDLKVTYRTGSIQNYLWYALKNSFGTVGLIVKENLGPKKNVCLLNLNFTFLNDEKTMFTISLSRNGYLLMQKDITVTQKQAQDLSLRALEVRQYVYFDLIAAAILDDPSFKKAFFSDKGKIE